MAARVDTKLYQDVGEIKGLLISMDKRLQRVERKQDEVLKKTARNSLVCSGVVSVTTALVIGKIKAALGV